MKVCMVLGCVHGLIHVMVFSINSIGNDFYEFRSSRIMTTNTHGTGCTLASAVAAELAKGSQMLSAVKVIDLVCLIYGNL